MQVTTAGTLQVSDTQAGQTQFVAGLSSRLDRDGLFSIQGIELESTSQSCCSHGNGDGHVQIIALTREGRVPLFDDIDIEITIRAAAGADLTLSGEA